MAQLTGADLLEPRGVVSPEMFPGEGDVPLGERLAGYLAQAYALGPVAAATPEATQNKLAKLWASHLAIMAAYRRMLLKPSSVQVAEKGGSSYTDEQREKLRELADELLAEYNAAVEATATGVPPSSGAVPNVYSF